ncbi:hypothetical protein H0H81_004339 [Sphagnurus paluster]|uniref:Uncharacterized protein n=1 Tax=Sphagnurus paluster TaxID=117069 RepID=A0A9P7GLY0_9AGAR|nr:hypothetical protein H0H81_004339 [Sphagnurus paluster]
MEIAIKSGHPRLLDVMTSSELHLSFVSDCTKIVQLLAPAPNLTSIFLPRCHLTYEQLGSIISSLRDKRLEALHVKLDTTSPGRIIPGLPNLKFLALQYGLEGITYQKASISSTEFVLPFIRPSLRTVRNLLLVFPQPGEGIDTASLGVDGPLPNLRILRLESDRMIAGIPLLPSLFPNLEKLTLLMDGSNPPTYKPDYIPSFAQLTKLTSLSTNLELDASAQDPPLGHGRSLAFFARSLNRRIAPTHELVAQCKALRHVYWYITDDMGGICHHFGVVDTGTPVREREERKVVIGWNWWMADGFKRMRSDPLPEGIVNLDPEMNAKCWSYYGP